MILSLIIFWAMIAIFVADEKGCCTYCHEDDEYIIETASTAPVTPASSPDRRSNHDS